MPSKNNSSMSLDEVEAAKLEIKNKIRELQTEYNELNDVRIVRVQEQHVVEAVRQLTRAGEASGRTVEQQAHYWLSDGDDGQKRQANLFLNGTTKGV